MKPTYFVALATTKLPAQIPSLQFFFASDAIGIVITDIIVNREVPRQMFRLGINYISFTVSLIIYIMYKKFIS